MSVRGAALRSLLVPGLVALPCLVLLLGLGIWQLERLAWKNALVATVEARVHELARPAPAEPDWRDVTYDADEYRHVTVRGRLHHDQEVQVYALIDAGPDRSGGPGYWVLTPLVQPDGAAIIVNRGFVPLDRKAPSTRPEGQVEGVVTITGLLRMPEEEGLFTPENDPGKDSWYTRDPDAIAAAKGILRVAPYIIDADATPNPGGYPVGGLTRVSFPNRHLEYALTWFGLAATLVGVFAAFMWSRLRRSRDANGPAGVTASE